MTLPVAILAGGLATRLGETARHIPKILVDVGGRPFAEHQLDRLQREGVTQVVYCIGYLGDQVRSTLGDGSRWDMRFTYVEDGPRPAGTGGAARAALPYVGDEFFVMYGDSYLDCSFRDVDAAFRAGGAPALMTVFRNDNQWDVSNVAYDGRRVTAYSKMHRTPDMRFIDYGLSLLTPSVFASYPASQPLDLADVYGDLVRDRRLAGVEVFDRFYEIGSPEGLEETRAFLAGATTRHP